MRNKITAWNSGQHSGNFFYRKSTIGTTIGAVEANNDRYYLQKRIEKFPLRATTIKKYQGKQ